MLLAIALRFVVIANTTLPSRDCIVFVRYALDLEDPPAATKDTPGGFFGVIQTAEHPPGYPLAILVVSKIVRPFAGGTSPNSMGLSAQIASALAGILLTFPLYGLTRRILDRNSAFAATAVFSVLPGFVEVTSDGISDGLFWLTTVTALWFAMRALRVGDRWAATRSGFGAGVMCGLGYLVRPESAVVALSIGLTLAGVVITLARRRWRSGIAQTGIRPRFQAGLALVVGWILVTVPYMILIGKITNKPTGEGWLKKVQGKEIDPTYFDRQGTRPAVRLPLAVWWDEEANKGQTRSVWALKSLWAEFWKASHYILPGFGLIGLIALRRRLSDPRLALLLILVSLNAILLWSLAMFIGYVSQRHTILIVLVTCIFAAAGFHYLATLAIHAWHAKTMSRWASASVIQMMQCANPWLLVAIWTGLLMAVALPRNFKSLHEERAGHKLAGLWMKDNVPADWQIVDPFGWAEWYSGRTLRAIPNPDQYRKPGLYAVFEPNAKSPHSRLGYYLIAQKLAAQGEIVYQYPEGVPPDEIKVAVYKAPPLKP